MGRLDGKVAIVTGGALGIGRVFCQGLAAEGAKVVIADIDDTSAQELADELATLGRDALVVHVDVSEVASTESMARATLERFGRIDVLVTCAAIYATLKRTRYLEMDPKEWEGVLAVNLTGAALSARAVLPAMQEQGSGSIINMGSVNTYIAPEGRAHYSAGKAALENFTKTLAREMGPHGIRVNALCPGLVRSGRAEVPEERYQRTAQERALRREMLPEDLLGPLLFLCCEDSSMVTGHSLVVDGGQIFR
jgi:NAD(P)-dependent dehydrogenase (short-subunit alcohol dehydrogenase family)